MSPDVCHTDKSCRLGLANCWAGSTAPNVCRLIASGRTDYADLARRQTASNRSKPEPDHDTPWYTKAYECPHRREVVTLGCCNGTLAKCLDGKAVDPAGTVDMGECVRCLKKGAASDG